MPNGIMFNHEYPTIENSQKLYYRAIGLIPSVTQTLAKGPSQYVNGVAPKFLARGRGSHVWDVDGNEYIDYSMGIGPIVLGYSYAKVDDAIKTQLDDGITFSLMHPLEVEVAELIREIIPNAEAVRFSKTGADVTSAAIRLARAYTGKDKVLCCGYHGWHDWYIAVTSRNNGIPKAVQNLSYTFNYNDIDSLNKSIDSNTAAIILEPVVFEEPKKNFLGELAHICNKRGIVLIFDEMWTGFRMEIGGAQEYFGVVPDLATYSKAIANGMPLSVLTGKKEIMQLAENDVFFFTTFGGEALSLSAAKATIKEIMNKHVPVYLNDKGRLLREGYNKLADELGLNFTRCVGYNFRSMVTFNHPEIDSLLLKSLVQQEMIRQGVLWTGFHNMCYSHSEEDISYTLKAYEQALSILRESVQKNNVAEMIKGKPIQPVFRKTDNFNTKPVTKI